MLLRCVCLLLVFTGLIASQPVIADKSTPQVLLINSWHKNTPWHKEVEKGLVKKLKELAPRSQLYIEYLDGARFQEKAFWPEVTSHWQKKYQSRDIDLIISEGFVAAEFLQVHPHLLAAIPRLYTHTGKQNIILRAQDSSLEVNFDFVRTFREIQQIHPFNKLYIVANTHSDHEQRRYEIVMKSLAEANIPFHTLADTPADELIERLAHIPKEDAIFYLPTFINHEGRHILPKDNLHNLVSIASAPIFTGWNSLLGSGTVGGHMLSGEHLGPAIATTALELIANQAPIQKSATPFHSAYDYKALQKWSIATEKLPTGVFLINRPIDFFSLYFWQIMSFFFAFALLALTTVFLIVSYRRKIRFTQQLEYERDHLEQRVHERTLQLESAKAQAEKLARTDVLTGLNNRRAFYELAREVHRSASRYQHPTCVLLIDLDYFKRINDTYGHGVGDQILNLAGQAIKNTLRTTDIAGRIGGEEFAVVITDTPSEQAEHAAERIRQAVEAVKVNTENEQVGVTISIGLAELQADDQSIEATLKRADIALYMSKAKGRNQLTCYPESPEKTAEDGSSP